MYWLWSSSTGLETGGVAELKGEQGSRINGQNVQDKEPGRRGLEGGEKKEKGKKLRADTGSNKQKSNIHPIWCSG